MHLLLESAYAWTILSNNHKQVLRIETDLLVLIDDFNVREVLPVGAHFILALHDENAVSAKNAVGFLSSPTIQVEHRRMVLGSN